MEDLTGIQRCRSGDSRRRSMGRTKRRGLSKTHQPGGDVPGTTTSVVSDSSDSRISYASPWYGDDMMNSNILQCTISGNSSAAGESDASENGKLFNGRRNRRRRTILMTMPRKIKSSTTSTTTSGYESASSSSERDGSQASWWNAPPTTPVRLPETNYDEYKFVGSEENRLNKIVREQRIKAMIDHYSSLTIDERTGNAAAAQSTTTNAIPSVNSFDEQSIIERGEEVTYGDFMTDQEGTSKGRSCMPTFQRFSKRTVDTTVDPRSESEEEPCDYDYYFSQALPSDSMSRTPGRANHFQPTLRSSPDRSSVVSSSDGSYSSEGSPSPADPVTCADQYRGVGCADQDQGTGYGCGTSSSRWIARTETQETVADQDEDAYCYFFPTSGSLPSIDEEAGPETTLCNWTDVEYYSEVCAAHSGKVLHHPSSQQWQWQCPADPDAWRDVTLLPHGFLDVVLPTSQKKLGKEGVATDIRRHPSHDSGYFEPTSSF